VFFLPLFEGGRGDLLFIAPPNAHKKPPLRLPQGRFFTFTNNGFERGGLTFD
jgi:hypothetical protein